jgi:hypothetical protein
MYRFLGLSLLAVGRLGLAAPRPSDESATTAAGCAHSPSSSSSNAYAPWNATEGHYSTPGSNYTAGSTCSDAPTSFQLSDPPYENYFYSDCRSATQVIVTSPRAGDDLTIIGPRLIVAWPAGNSGVAAFFSPANGVNGTLAIGLDNSTSGAGALSPVYLPPPSGSQYPSVGVSGVLKFNDSAVLSLAILGSKCFWIT